MTFSFAARSDFPTDGNTHLVLPAKPDWPARCCLLCALHPWEVSGRLAGRTEGAPNQWTPGLSEHSSTVQQLLHHLAVLPPEGAGSNHAGTILNGRDTSSAEHAAAGSRGPILLQRNTLRVTSKDTHEARAAEQCGLEQAPTGQSSGKGCLRYRGGRLPCRVDLTPRVHSQSSAVMLKMLLDTCLVPCVIGSCPLGREGPLGCHVLPYI